MGGQSLACIVPGLLSALLIKTEKKQIKCWTKKGKICRVLERDINERLGRVRLWCSNGESFALLPVWQSRSCAATEPLESGA